MNIIVSKKYKDYELVEDKIAYSNLFLALKECKDGDIIYLVDEVYYGHFILRTSNITIMGMDDTLITYDAYHKMKRRSCDGGDGDKVYGTSGSATFTVTGFAKNFKCFNVSFENSHDRTNFLDGGQAVALKTEALNGWYENCRFFGYQDTLYVDESDNVFVNCYITGDVDFIFGAGNAIFDKCSIEVRSNHDNAYVTAPSTFKTNSYGYLFYQCKITSRVEFPIYLGRPWFSRGGMQDQIEPRCLFYKCSFPSNMLLEFKKMRDYDPICKELYYYKCILNNKEVSNLYDERIVSFYETIYKEWK